MTGSLMTADDYPAVRRLIDLSLDPVSVPDQAISDLAPLADAWVVQADPAALTRVVGDPGYVAARVASRYVAAAYLVPSIPNLTSERFEGSAYTREKWDPAVRTGQLLGMAFRLLQSYLGTAGLPFLTAPAFTVAQADRPPIFPVDPDPSIFPPQGGSSIQGPWW